MPITVVLLFLVALGAWPSPVAHATTTSPSVTIGFVSEENCGVAVLASAASAGDLGRYGCRLAIRTTTAVAGGFDVALSFAWTDNEPDGVVVTLDPPMASCPASSGGLCSDVSLRMSPSSITWAPDTQHYRVTAARLCGGTPCAGDEAHMDRHALILRASKTTVQCIPDPVPFYTPSTCVIRVVDVGGAGIPSTPTSTPAMWTQIVPTQNGFRQPSTFSSPCYLIEQASPPAAPYTAECDYGVQGLWWPFRYAATYMAGIGWAGDAAHARSGTQIEIIPEPRATVSYLTCGDVYIGELVSCDVNVGDADIGVAQTVHGNVSVQSPVTSSGLHSTYDWACELAQYAPPAFSVCSFTFAPFAPGAIPVTARYEEGLFPIFQPSVGTTTVNVLKRPTVTAVACGPGNILVGEPGSCTVSVQDLSGYATPSGYVSFGVSGATPSLAGPGIDWSPASCLLVPTGADSRATCTVSLAPATGAAWPAPREVDILASYPGDGLHVASDAHGLLKVFRRDTSTYVGCTPDVTIPIEGPTPAAACDAILTDVSPGTSPAFTGGAMDWSSGESFAGPAQRTSITWIPTTVGFHWRFANYTGDVDHQPSGGSGSVRVHAETRVAYTGALSLTAGTPLRTSATAASASPACAMSRAASVQYALDHDPWSGALAPMPIATASLDATGASALDVPTAGWLAGTYRLTTRLLGTASCDESLDVAFLVVGAAGQVATAGGTTGSSTSGSSSGAQLASASPAQQLTFSAQKRGDAYNGTFVLTSDAWRVRGTVATLTKTSANGVTRCAADGSAELQVAVVNEDGRTTWASAPRGSAIPFSLYIEDHGSDGGDAFALHLGRIGLPSDPALPLSGATAHLVSNGDVGCR